MSDWFERASTGFGVARAVVVLLGVIAFLIFAVIGYIATGGSGGGLGGFLRFLGLG